MLIHRCPSLKPDGSLAPTNKPEVSRIVSMADFRLIVLSRFSGKSLTWFPDRLGLRFRVRKGENRFFGPIMPGSQTFLFD
jgi:hypothetical protein